MLRRIFSAAIIAVPVFAPSLTAQELYTWNADRPDAFASPGIIADRTLSGGEVQLWYRFHDGEVEGVQFGKDRFEALDFLDFYPIVPLRQTSRIHEAGFGFSPVQGVTLTARGSWGQFALEEVTAEGGFFRTESSGIGDVEVEALVDVYDDGPYRAHVGMGVSIPTGSVTERGLSAGSSFQLPYTLQTGSGSVELLPSGAILAMNEWGSVGLRARGTIRLMENSRDYRLPHGFELAGWGARRLNDYFSISAGVVLEHWGQISGEDPELDFEISFTEDPTATGGTFVDLPVGLNLYVRDGLLAGNRFSVEGRWPVSQNAVGPQLRRDMRLTAQWQRAVSLF